MSLAAAPFGIRPLGGKSVRTRSVKLTSSNAEIFKHDVVYMTATGADRLASDTDSAQVGLLGVALEHKAASDAGWILLADVLGNDFEAQTYSANTTFAFTDGTDLGAGITLRASTAGDSTTKTSKQTIEAKATGGSDHCGYIIGLAPIPGNDAASTTTNYPILRFRFKIGASHDADADI